ncbi:hypothetical protein ASE14_04570 [Agromyces sp. Root81]|nr:hypothetical protein ASE14_04570 [Agromyces sp. Root81]
MLFDSQVPSAEQEIALQQARTAFSFVQDKHPEDLHAIVAHRLPPEADPHIFSECELVSLSAAWRSETQSLRLSLAYGFDGGVYAVASLCCDTVDHVSLVD